MIATSLRLWIKQIRSAFVVFSLLWLVVFVCTGGLGSVQTVLQTQGSYRSTEHGKQQLLQRRCCLVISPGFNGFLHQFWSKSKQPFKWVWASALLLHFLSKPNHPTSLKPHSNGAKPSQEHQELYHRVWRNAEFKHLFFKHRPVWLWLKSSQSCFK